MVKMVKFLPVPVGRLSLVLLCFWTCNTGTEALQWLNSAQNDTTHQVCSGNNFTFPWLFALDKGEQLEDIKWLYISTGSSTPDLTANYIYGHFITLPPYTDRLVYLGNGDLALSHVTPSDTGTYIVEVVTTQGGGTSYLSKRRHLLMQVVEVPSSPGGSLSVGIRKQAVYDNVTGEWHILLTCAGHFLSPGHPLLHVAWKTPSGSELTSSYSENGTFFVMVPNPVKEGDYMCNVTYPSSFALCLPNNTTLTHVASLHMDAATASTVLLEAKQEALLEQNQMLTNLVTHTRDKLAQTDSMLTQTRQELSTTMTKLSNTTEELTMTKNLLDNVRRGLINVQEEMNDLRNCCRTKETTLPTENTAPSMSPQRDVSYQLTETKYLLNDLRGNLTNVQEKVNKLEECCTAQTLPPVDHTSYMKPDLPDPTNMDSFTSSFLRETTEDVTTVPQEPVTRMKYEAMSSQPRSYMTGYTVTRKTSQEARTEPNTKQVLQNLTNHIHVLEYKLQQLQAQSTKSIAFQAQASYQQYKNNDHIQFNEEVFTNNGNAFNQSSGEFVVPVNGVYVFLASTSAYGVYGSSSNADLMVDNRTVARMLGKYMNSYDQATGHAVMSLHRGQKVWVRSVGATAIDSRSIFSGFLLKPH